VSQRNEQKPGAVQDPLNLRGEPRIGTDLDASLYTSDFSGALPARTRDVSIGGACIVTASPFAFKAVQRVCLRLPEGGALDLEAQGRWQQALAGDDVVMTGLEFLRPSDASVDRLWDLVLDGGKRLARFLYGDSELRAIGVDGAMGLAQMTRIRELAPGTTLYRQDQDPGDPCSIFVVEEGVVVLQMRARGVREVPVERVEAGGIFGGLTMLAGVPPTESAVTETDTRVLEFDLRAYQYLARAKPWLAQQLSQVVTTAYVKRLQRVLERVRDHL